MLEVESNRCSASEMLIGFTANSIASLERIQAYLEIEHEPKAVESGNPPAAWPTSGDLRVENLAARYSQVSK